MNNMTYEMSLNMLRDRGSECSEEDVKNEIVFPILKSQLGYDSSCIYSEYQKNMQRPDYICNKGDGELDLIVEAKNLGADLDLRPSPTVSAKRIPKVQLEQYLKKWPTSKHGVFGLLTNG